MYDLYEISCNILNDCGKYSESAKPSSTPASEADFLGPCVLREATSHQMTHFLPQTYRVFYVDINMHTFVYIYSLYIHNYIVFFS